MRQPKKARPKCPTCGKPGTKWTPLPHDHRPAPSTTGKPLDFGGRLHEEIRRNTL